MKQYGPVILLALTAFGGTAAGQAMVGYGLGAARAVTSIAPAQGIGKALERPAKRLQTITRSADSTVFTRAQLAAHYEDPAKIEAGISYTDLLRRFGPPTLQITGDDGVRTLTYLAKSCHLQLVVRDDKVGGTGLGTCPAQAAAPAPPSK